MGTTALEWCDRLLAVLGHRMGDVGLAAAETDPALRAEIQRHEGEIRTWLNRQGLAVSRRSIAGYAAVVLTAAQHCGRLLPADPQLHDWPDAEWYLLRLLALLSMTEAR